MNNQSCVYIVNEHPLYMKMTMNSMRMLRSHNKDITVRCVFIRDSSAQTVVREPIVNPSAVGNADNFIQACKAIDVELWQRPPLLFRGEEKFFHINRMYLNDVPEDSVLYIDSDTFIFGDIQKIFDTYPDNDLAACEAKWVRSKGWKEKFLPSGHVKKPFSSGVMLWNNGAIHDWARNLRHYCRDLRMGRYPISKWLYKQHQDCLLREEFSVSLHVALEGNTFEYLDEKDCQLIRHESDLLAVGKSLMFHSYTPNWKRIYDRINYNLKPVKGYPIKITRRSRNLQLNSS